MRVVEDDDVDRPQVQAWRRVEPSGTNNPKAFVTRAEPQNLQLKKKEKTNVAKAHRARRGNSNTATAEQARGAR